MAAAEPWFVAERADQQSDQPDRIILNTAVAPLDNQAIEQLIAQVAQWYEVRQRASA